MLKNAVEDIEPKHYKYAENLIMSHGLPLSPHDFQSLKDQKHTKSWQFLSDIGKDSRVNPPKRCINQYCHLNQNDFWVDNADDIRIFVYKQ